MKSKMIMKLKRTAVKPTFFKRAAILLATAALLTGIGTGLQAQTRSEAQRIADNFISTLVGYDRSAGFDTRIRQQIDIDTAIRRLVSSRDWGNFNSRQQEQYLSEWRRALSTAVWRYSSLLVRRIQENRATIVQSVEQYRLNGNQFERMNGTRWVSDSTQSRYVTQPYWGMTREEMATGFFRIGYCGKSYYMTDNNQRRDLFLGVFMYITNHQGAWKIRDIGVRFQPGYRPNIPCSQNLNQTLIYRYAQEISEIVRSQGVDGFMQRFMDYFRELEQDADVEVGASGN